MRSTPRLTAAGPVVDPGRIPGCQSCQSGVNCLFRPMSHAKHNTTSVTEDYAAYVMPTYARFPIIPERGEGARLWDVDGNEYLDFGAGIAVCALGHAHPAIREAMIVQASKLMHTSNLYYIPAQGHLARRLVECVGQPGKVFFCNSGAEANEGLFKLARRFGDRTGGRHRIVTFEGSFHGRTLAGIAATGQGKVRDGFGPLMDGFHTVPFNDMAAVEAATDDATCAVLVEPIQGEGGIHIADTAFLRALREHCDRHRLLLLFDEVQCGLGRTGDWCGWRSVGAGDVAPDGVSWAKGIAGGYPMGSLWAADRTPGGLDSPLSALLGPGSHGTTYGGNPLACVIALTVLDVIKRDGLLVQAATLGELAVDALSRLDDSLIADVRGVGLMIGIELSEDFADRVRSDGAPTPSLALVRRLHSHGLLTVPAGPNVIRLLPPLNVGREEVESAVSIIGQTMKSLKP